MNSSYAFHLQPENKYIIKNQQNSWNLLCTLDSYETDDILSEWRRILKTQYDLEI
jgi:hypothetical protein